MGTRQLGGIDNCMKTKNVLVVVASIFVFALVSAAYIFYDYHFEPRGMQVVTEVDLLNFYRDTATFGLSAPHVYTGVLGIYKGRVIERKFFCSHNCPEYGEYSIVYTGISSWEAAKCSLIGGVMQKDSAGGKFVGCSAITHRMFEGDI